MASTIPNIGKFSMVGLFVLAGCASAPTSYARQPWATVPEAQAEAECENYLSSGPGLTSSMYLCMKSKGYFENGM